MKFTSEDGKEEEFYVEEQIRVNGTDYLLVTTSREDDAEALILKDISEPSSEEAQYVPVEDETELDAVVKVFRETLDNTDIQT